MKTFLLISGGLLLLALVIVVVVFFYLSFQIKTTQSNLPSTTTTTTASVETGIEAEREATPAVHLRDLPINDSQQKVLETVGVEVDTFVITPAMQTCAAEKLGTNRVQDIVAGDTPTALETAKLVPCLGAE